MTGARRCRRTCTHDLTGSGVGVRFFSLSSDPSRKPAEPASTTLFCTSLSARPSGPPDVTRTRYYRCRRRHDRFSKTITRDTIICIYIFVRVFRNDPNDPGRQEQMAHVRPIWIHDIRSNRVPLRSRTSPLPRCPTTFRRLSVT